MDFVGYLLKSKSVSVQYSWIIIFILHLQFHAGLGLAEWEVVNKVYIHHIGIVDDSFGFCTLQKRCPWYGCNLFPWIIERVSYASGDSQVLDWFIRQFHRCHTWYVFRCLSDKGFLLSLVEQLQSPFIVCKVYWRNDRIARMVPLWIAQSVYLMEHFWIQSQSEYI